MKRIFTAICTSFVCVLIFASGEFAHAAVRYAITSTATTVAQGSPTSTDTPVSTASVTPTTTLEPLPAITLIFPELTATATATITPTPIPVTETAIAPDGGQAIGLSPRLRVIAIVVVILWVILAGFVVIYVRQFK